MTETAERQSVAGARRQADRRARSGDIRDILEQEIVTGERGAGERLDEQIEIMRARLARIISEQTGQKLEKVMKDIERDHWMDTKEAMEYGILSRVITHASDL